MSKSESNGIKIHRTDKCGNIVYKSTGLGINTDCSIKSSYTSGNKTENSTEVNNSNTTTFENTSNRESVNNNSETTEDQWNSYNTSSSKLMIVQLQILKVT